MDPPMPNSFGASDYISLPDIPTRPAPHPPRPSSPPSPPSPSPPSDETNTGELFLLSPLTGRRLSVHDDVESREAPRSTTSSIHRMNSPTLTTHLPPLGRV